MSFRSRSRGRTSWRISSAVASLATSPSGTEPAQDDGRGTTTFAFGAEKQVVLMLLVVTVGVATSASLATRVKNMQPTKGRGVSERDFEKWMVEVARRFGWKCWHFHDSRRQVKPGVFVGDKDAAGVCDWILIHDDPPRLIFAEVKGDKGRLSEAQQEFLRMAREVAYSSRELIDRDDWTQNMGVYVWQPGLEQAIEDVLRSKVLS